MSFVKNLPNELQFLIMKYLTYSPTSTFIKKNEKIILKKQIYYLFINNKFDIFHTNDTIKTERIFQHRIMQYIYFATTPIDIQQPLDDQINGHKERQQFFKEKLKGLLKLMQASNNL